MFGIDSFLFGAILWGLPLAALPVVLHLLFRRKSPVVPFPTLRFVRASLQHTAARRRIQRWILLATRILMLALLIAAIAQPVRILASSWMAGGQSMVAAIVVDTSYSMQLDDQQVKLIARADDITQELLRGTLANAKIAILKSRPPVDGSPISFAPAAAVLKDWRPLAPEPAPEPLSARVAAAIDLLSRQNAEQKRLIIISDLQSREFPGPLPSAENVRTILFDLHPDEPRSFGITSVRLEPDQPIPGVGCTAIVEVAGRAADSRAVSLSVMGLDGNTLFQKGPAMASFNTAGRTQVRFDLKEGLPAERWLRIAASLPEDAMAWDNSREILVEMPPRQNVTVLSTPQQASAEGFVRLVLDPWEGKQASWPVAVRSGNDLSGQEQVAVAMWSDWPSEQRAARLAEFVRGGGTLVLFLQPGLEQSWNQLDANRRTAIAAILPAAPLPSEPPLSAYRAAPAPGKQALLAGLTDASFRLSEIVVRRFVPLARPEGADTEALLSLVPAHPTQGARNYGLLAKRTVGSGAVYAFSTLPDALSSNLPTHPLFLPLMVRMSLRSSSQSDAQNVEIGQALVVPAGRLAAINKLNVEMPDKAVEQVPVTLDQNGRRFAFAKTDAPGRYTWHKTDEPAGIVALGNVQCPSAESDLAYRNAADVVGSGPDVLVARNFEQFKAAMAKVSEPEPKWSGVLAGVILLLCAEALLGSMSQLWKPLALSGFLPRMLTAGEGR